MVHKSISLFKINNSSISVVIFLAPKESIIPIIYFLAQYKKRPSPKLFFEILPAHRYRILLMSRYRPNCDSQQIIVSLL